MEENLALRQCLSQPGESFFRDRCPAKVYLPQLLHLGQVPHALVGHVCGPFQAQCLQLLQPRQVPQPGPGYLGLAEVQPLKLLQPSQGP